MNRVRAASIHRQAQRLSRLRGLGRGLGQSAVITQTTSCPQWAVLPNSDPLWGPMMQAIVAGGFSTPQLVNGDWHFIYSGTAPAGSMFAGASNILAKVNAIAGANPNEATIEVCASSLTMAVPGAAATTPSSYTPYIVAGVLGVLLIGGLLLAED
jgi:hypothetical protein